MKFFNPTGELKELLLLQYIEKNHNCTQKELGDVIGAAPSMVNVYINGLEEKNFLKRDYISPKMVNYMITHEGIKNKNYLVISYMRELFDLYQLAKKNVEDFLSYVEDKGYKRILVYGAGEVSETILSVARERVGGFLEIVALVDDRVDKQGSEFMGYKVIGRDSIGEYDHDGVVVASYTFEEDIVDRLEEIGYSMDSVVRFFGEDISE